jgi:hypothetical protein
MLLCMYSCISCCFVLHNSTCRTLASRSLTAHVLDMPTCTVSYAVAYMCLHMPPCTSVPNACCCCCWCCCWFLAGLLGGEA